MQIEELRREICDRLPNLSDDQVEALWEYMQILTAADVDALENSNKYLTFYCCDQVFGMDIRQVVQIIGIPPVTPLPESSPHMRGVASVRDEMIPVVDLRVRLGKEAVAVSEKSCLVVTNVQDHSIGILVDAISNVETILPEEICPPPRQDGHNAEYLTGIVKRNTVILLVDVDALLTAKDIDLLNMPASALV